MSLRVLSPGTLTTVQDRGRRGWRHLGVPLAGALDESALRVANLLVGNDPGGAALEITLSGPRLWFESQACIALAGAGIAATANGIALPSGRPIALPAGTELALGACRDGARSYLAIAGGFDVPWVLGSASTDLRNGFGGHEGRALAAGDRLSWFDAHGSDARLPAPGCVEIPAWWVASGPEPTVLPAIIRYLPGSDLLEDPDAFPGAEYRVTADANRQGLRLSGPTIAAADQRERVSAPVAPGAIQLPPGGQPIVLLADAQTVGGYPCIGHAIAADWPRLAQLRPGDRLRFLPCAPTDARRLACRQRQRLARIALAIAQRRRLDASR